MRSFSTYILILIGVTFTLLGCSRHKVEGVVVKDCTGVYLQINNKDYLVCNYDMLSNISAGNTIAVDFHKDKNCSSFDFVCELYHPFEYRIVVDKIY